MNKRRSCSKKWLILIGLAVCCLLPSSCEKSGNPETLLKETMDKVNSSDSEYKDFTVYNNTSYYAIKYSLKNTPENKAKILWLANHEELADRFRSEMLNKLKAGDILKRVVKEKKDLVLAVGADEIEYYVVIDQEEIKKNVFKR